LPNDVRVVKTVGAAQVGSENEARSVYVATTFERQRKVARGLYRRKARRHTQVRLPALSLHPQPSISR
jgi:hypothetical protein